MSKISAFSFIALSLFLATSKATANRQTSTNSPSWRIKKIAVDVGTMSQTAIFVIDPPNSKPRLLVEGAYPTWSPAGGKIAYCGSQGPGGVTQIWVINADGSGRKQYTKVKWGACFPDWSPDGKKIAFSSYGSKVSTVSIMNEDGESITSVTDGYRARWSPDGKQFVFYRDPERRGTKGSIWIVNADGTAARKIMEDVSELSEPTWLPDGKSIAFVSERQRSSSISRIHLDGTGLESVAADRQLDFYFPLFSPDGKQLIVDAIKHSNPGSIMLIDLTTHEGTILGHGLHPSVLWERTEAEDRSRLHQ